MKRSNRLVLLIGVFLAAVAFVLVVVLVGGGGGSGSAESSAPPAKVATVVASKDIALGVAITADMVKTQDLAPDLRLPGSFGDVSQVVNSVARASLKAGQQITAASFAESSGANLEVPAGLTGIAVQVDQLTGVGTLIKTGDYVDVIVQISPGSFPLNYFAKPSVPANGVLAAPINDPTSVKVLLQGLQVITTILPPPPAAETGVASPAPDAGSGGSASAGVALNGQQEIVILAVTPQQAEIIKFAQVDGNITLTLRSPKDFVDKDGKPVVPQTVVTSGIVLKTLIDTWGVLPPTWVIVPEPVPAK
ncbi:MAG: Flp pilus assembly protein CpaB [Chloroflexota bacterium]